MNLKKQFVRIKNWVILTAKSVAFEIKRDALLIVFGFVHTVANAQNVGVGGLNTATTDIKEYVDPVQKLIYAIAAVVAIVGAFSIFFKMQNGDQDVKKSIMMIVGGCIALVTMATVLPKFFGL